MPEPSTHHVRPGHHFRFRPTLVPFGADPELSTHRAYGLPSFPITPELMAAIETGIENLGRLPAQDELLDAVRAL